MSFTATVFLVGAGPGDPGLLTRRGAQLLGQAEVVIYDGLVNPQLLRLAPSSAELIYGGKNDRKRAVSQAELNATLIRKAREGRRVVRLKGGDPYVLGRGGEEAEALARAGIPFEVVPGVSSVLGASCCAGIPLTHRAYCSGFTVVTGHEDYVSPTHALDWRTLAQTPGTLVILMGLGNLDAIVSALTANGGPATTPAAVISWGSTPRQKTVVGTLGDLVRRVKASGLKPPAITIVGEVVQLREKLNWFERRPLFGQRVVITQRNELAQPVCAALRELGADALEVPATAFELPEDRRQHDRVLAEAAGYDWILFSNPWVLDRFLEMWLDKYEDLRRLGAVRLGTFGPMTGARLREWKLKADAIAADHKPNLILEALTRADSLAGRRILVLRAEDASPEMIEPLIQRGAQIEDFHFYRTRPETADVTGDAARLLEHGADWIVFASALAINHFNHRFNLPELIRRFPHIKIALASPAINWALEKLGLCAHTAAKPNDLASLVEHLIRHRHSSAR